MDQAGFPSALVFDLKKESPFSFKCQACNACCNNKAIPVSPYESLRLARNLGLTTTEFLKTCTEEGGTILRNRPDGSCIFLGSGGCSVHPDRPLVCRLFPLGQITDEEKQAKYAAMPVHPDCLGHFDVDGTVDSYLESQELGPYFHYDVVYGKLLKKLRELGHEEAEGSCPGAPHPSHPDPSFRSTFLSMWLDVDKTVAALCRKKGRIVPERMEDAVSAHLEAIEGWLTSLRKRRGQELRKKSTSLL